MESQATIYAVALLASTEPVARHEDDRPRTSSAIRAVRGRRRSIAVIALVGAIVVAGLATAGVAAAAAGDLDPSFDRDGKRVLPFAGIPNEALVQPDGKIVLAGFDEKHDFAVWRLNTDGSLDRSFDGDGTVAISFGTPGRHQRGGPAAGRQDRRGRLYVLRADQVRHGRRAA